MGKNLQGPLTDIASGVLEGVNTPDSDCASDWGWTAYTYQVPEDWSSGVYIAMFQELDQNGVVIPGQPLDLTTADANEGKAMFIVRAQSTAKRSILFKVSTATNQAYNYEGHGSTYRDYIPYLPGEVAGDPTPWACSLMRPGNGTGGLTTFTVEGVPDSVRPRGTPSYQLDVYDRSSDRMKIVHLEGKFISWLEANGYADLVDYCSDFDLHWDPELLTGYGLLLSVGHDEYWSETMRANVTSFGQQGGNVAFFSGNTCYKHITFYGQGMFTNDGTWYAVRPDMYEDKFTGVSYFHANGRWDGKRQVVGYTLQHRGHWILEQVKKSVIGEHYTDGTQAALIGYECDGAKVTKQNGIITPTSEYGTPANFLVLGYAQLDESWEDNADVDTQHMPTMGVYTNPGTMFTVGTVDWARVLASGGEPDVEQITRNVLNRLGCSPFGLAPLLNVATVFCCDGFYSDDDKDRHAITGSADGTIIEIYYNPNTFQGQTVITKQNNLIDLGAFYSHNDKFRHIITATADGTITDTKYNADNPAAPRILGGIPGATRVCGFYSPDDKDSHAIVADDSGNITELFYDGAGEGSSVIANFGNLVDMGAFYSPDDKTRHVLVGTSDGNITEVYYASSFPPSQSVIANVPGLIRVTAYYATDDKFFNRRVQVLTNEGRVYEIRYHPDYGVIKAVLTAYDGLVDLGGFFTPDDGNRHAILAWQNGDIRELFFNP